MAAVLSSGNGFARLRARQKRRARPDGRILGRRWWLPVTVLLAYPLTVLVYVYGHSLAAGLPGGRHGPLDAYRHTLASAFVAYTLSPRAVAVVTRLMESSPDLSSWMDRHNNAIGAEIGAEAASLRALQLQVRQRVLAGGVLATEPKRVTWMPPATWNRLPF